MSEEIKIAAVVAMAENRCIGKDGDLPWHIPADLKHFKAVTMGKPIIMGRKTFESIVARLGKPLPGRLNIVITRQQSLPLSLNPSPPGERGPVICAAIDEAIEAAKEEATKQNLSEVIIGGGAQIYEQAMPYTDRIYLTVVHQAVDGDAFFPELDETQWKETDREDHEGDPPFSFRQLARA